MDGYSAEIEQKMQRFFGWLSEKDRRRYAAVEAAKLGHGGVEYIARVLGCDPQTIRQGLRDLEEAEDAAAPWRTFVWLSGLRWAIEQCFEEGKTELGMAHYEVRKYPGWHHHMLMTMLAHFFLWQDRKSVV